MKTKVLIGTAIILFAALSSLVLWPTHHWDSLPRIRDAEQLRHDCALLCQKYPLESIKSAITNAHASVYLPMLRQRNYRTIAKEDWPDSIKKLQPILVGRDEYAVFILLIRNPRPSAQENWGGKGYYVHTNPLKSPPRSAMPALGGLGEYNLYETKYDGIDEYDWPAAIR